MSLDAWMMTARRWQLQLMIGVVFGLFQFLTYLTVLDQGLGEALGSGLISGVIFGILFGGYLAWTIGEQRRTLQLDDRAEQRAAVRAVGRGPVPEDPEVRAAALRLARRRLVQTEQARSPFAVVAVGVLVLGLAAVAVWLSPWAWIGPPVVLLLWGYSRFQAQRLAGRAALLDTVT